MIDFAIVAVYLALILAVGLAAARRRRGGLEEYVLAGRSLTLPMFVATLVTSFYGGVFGVGEFSWRYGLSNWVVMGAPYYLFGAVYAFFFAGKIRVRPGMTIPDHLEEAYGPALAVFGAFLIFLLTSPADELLMLGTMLSWASGLERAPCLLLAAFLAVAYIYRGGLRSDVWTNLLEIGFMFGGFFLILPFAWAKLGGLDYLQRNLPPAHLTLSGGKSAGYLLAWYLIAFWTLIDPTFHQRACAAQDPKTARNGILLSIGFWCVFDFMTTSAGLYARALMPELSDPMLAYPMLAERLLPPVVRGLFFAGMMTSMIASLDSVLLISAIALAKDGLGRLSGSGPQRQESWVRWALPVSAAVGLVLALALPSVVDLWYAVGSTVNPGLLLPLVSVYFPRLRVSPGWALASSVAGWGIATAWFLWGRLIPPAPLGIEPMYAGLAPALLLWAAGLLTR